MFYIYVYENKISGKIYVGQAINLDNRDKRHIQNNGSRDNSLIDKKISQYGRKNFDLWIISVVDTKDQANQEERFWIAEMRNQLGRKMVYNLTDGGDGLSGFNHSEASKKKISEAKKGKAAANKGIPFSDQTKVKMSLSHLGHFGYWNNKTLSQETCNKKSKAMMGKTWKMINGKRVWSDKEND